MTDQHQQSLGMDSKKPLDSVEKYEFEPIKGYPMLNWKGKRPFTSTYFFPAQIREQYGSPINNWMNMIFWGDNLQVMSYLLKYFRGKINLIYIDPPYDSKADYKKKIQLKGHTITNDHTAFEEKQYTDIWSNDEYLQFIYERLILARELLSDDGSIFVHCDWHKGHHIRCILDEVFGNGGSDGKGPGYKNEIIWCYSIGGKSNEKFGEKHDTIYWYSKTSNFIFNPEGAKIPRKPNSHMRVQKDDSGKEYQAKTDRKTGKEYIYYLDEGKIAEDYWIDIETLNREDAQRENYPTQKPEKLLERIISSCSNKGDIVFDFFMGSGTTQAVAMKLGRKFIGADINLGSIQVTTKRLADLQISLKNSFHQLLDGTQELHTGFQVLNINYYDVFRNPLEAKEIIISALEIQRFDSGMFFDGEKDGRMVKIMPVNRIATRADLSELINGFDYKTFQKRHEQNPGKPVEKIILVCMGHEPDLAAYLENEVKPLKIEVDVVDILRDKQELQFKRDSEAKVITKEGYLIIEKFYPMNLLQKLSLQQENVKNWRELVESVMIDWNYDGAVLEPTVVDIPEGDELVKGKYKIPEGVGTIRVKITDLLSESLEVEVQYA